MKGDADPTRGHMKPQERAIETQHLLYTEQTLIDVQILTEIQDKRNEGLALY